MLAFEESLSENRKLKAEICELKNEVKELKEINVKKDEKINELMLEIKRLKNNKSKDSSNSSKPSSKNNYKKVKNSREKTLKKQGGQQNHKGYTSDIRKIEELINSGDVIYEVIEVNKTSENQENFGIRYIQDIEIRNVVRKYIYYVDKNGRYNIPKSQSNLVTYGENLKAISMLLVHKMPASMDQVKYFWDVITKSAISLTKATLVNWTNDFSCRLEPLIKEIC
jgi:hypothetical protein